MIVEISKGVYWVGVTDWALKSFHGHELSTHRGSSYNSYLILDEKTALVDTVWEPFSEQFIRNVESVVDPAEIDFIVVNHAEVDHAGALPALIERCPRAAVVVSPKGADSVEGLYHREWNLRTVKTGDRISLGGRELVFFEAPMLHWPDTMFTYLTGSNILMSNDGFGQHYATDFRFNDLVNREELYEEALKYYVNILTPFSKQVIRRIEEFKSLGLPLEMIAPSHGVIWRDGPLQIVEKYLEWARQAPEKRAVILYDTMWQGTRLMAEAIADGLAAKGVNHKIFHMAVADRNDVLVEVFKSKAVIVGSPTFNNGLLPSIAPVLGDLKGLKFQNKIGAAFGAYGWSGESVKLIEEQLRACRFPLAAEGVRAKWRPKEADLDRCRGFGREIAAAVLAD